MEKIVGGGGWEEEEAVGAKDEIAGRQVRGWALNSRGSTEQRDRESTVSTQTGGLGAGVPYIQRYQF